VKSIDNLSSGEILCLGIAIEDLNTKRYDEWSDRFRPYDVELSELFKDMCDEERMHSKQLRDIYLSCFGDRVIPMDPSDYEDPLELVRLDTPHFFVVDDAMAERILGTALTCEERARAFYTSLLDRTHDPLLEIIYRKLAYLEEEHVVAIKRRLDTFRAARGGR
jgi:rubrerythrin